MKFQSFLILAMVISGYSAAPSLKDDELPIAVPCNDQCQLPECSCESTKIPKNLDLKDTPQFVFLTYDDAVRQDNFDYYSQALFGRKNPDGCNVTATAFVSHEYTVYPKVHELYENGFEIALHSITHLVNTTYWKTADVDTLKQEFGGERQLISKFADIPEDHFTGIRLPFLQLSGNNSFEMIKELGLEYDCSWPTRTYTKPGLWPYTLDYSTNQDCPVGPCPTASIPGVWVVPMLDWKDQKDVPCAMVDQCVNIPTEPDEIVEWIKTNFLRSYNNNKAPFGFYMHATWFAAHPERITAYTAFVDYLQTLEDVYIVNIKRGLEWIKNPVPIGSADWPACPTVEKAPCEPLACRYVKEETGTEIYMHICNQGEGCPPNYPTVDNPLGQ